MALSPKALGLLLHVYAHGASGGSKGLSEAFGRGRDYVSSGLIELRSNDLVALIKGKTDKGNFWSTVEITQKGVDLLKVYTRKGKYRAGKPATVPIRKTRSSIRQNSNLANYPNSIDANSVNQGDALYASHKENEEFIGDIDMTLWVDPDDLDAEIEKDRQRKADERAEGKRKAYAKRQQIRATRPVEKWTPTDVVNYFAEIVKEVWHISEVTTDQRPGFIKALTIFRADFGTKGHIEKEILDQWMSSQKHDTDKRSPDALFYGFIKYAPTMLEEAKRALAPEDTSDIDEQRAKLRAKLGMN